MGTVVSGRKTLSQINYLYEQVNLTDNGKGAERVWDLMSEDPGHLFSDKIDAATELGIISFACRSLKTSTGSSVAYTKSASWHTGREIALKSDMFHNIISDVSQKKTFKDR